MNLWRDIPVGDKPPDTVNVIIEVVSGSRDKYEYKIDWEIFVLDHMLYSSVVFPARSDATKSFTTRCTKYTKPTGHTCRIRPRPQPPIPSRTTIEGKKRKDTQHEPRNNDKSPRNHNQNNTQKHQKIATHYTDIFIRASPEKFYKQL